MNGLLASDLPTRPASSGVWSIRGGFSRSYDLTYANLTANAAPAFFQTTQDVRSEQQHA